LLVMMISGAIGFYLGIDTPAQSFEQGHSRKIDSAEFLSAAGTFLAALTAFVSVGLIVLRNNTQGFWTTAIVLAWIVGVTMQIVAGTIARVRAR
jgi:archaellum biogenesis protein FlaJ (TadC family)